MLIHSLPTTEKIFVYLIRSNKLWNKSNTAKSQFCVIPNRLCDARAKNNKLKQLKVCETFMSKRARVLLRNMSTKATSSTLNNKIPTNPSDPPLKYKVLAKCGTSKARVGVMTLRHGDVNTPVFMPVGTQVC